MKQSIWIVGLVGIFAISMIAASISVIDASAAQPENPDTPLYKTTCAHGHNSFNCSTPQYKIDISALQEKTMELEQRISNLEKR